MELYYNAKHKYDTFYPDGPQMYVLSWYYTVQLLRNLRKRDGYGYCYITY